MRTYKANNKSNPINKRVKKVHSKAKLVGMLYFLGAVALAVLACLPTILIDGAKLWVVNFWKPYTNLFNANRNIFDVIVATLYAFVVLSAVINALRCLGKLGNLLRKNHKKIGRIKQNMQAMDDMGKLFSGSFAAIVIFHFLIYIIQPVAAGANRPAIELCMPFGYLSLGVGLVIHFFVGLIHGTVSNFDVGGHVANVVEEKRECGLFVYFFRNLVQVAAVAAILYFFTQCCNFNGIVFAFINGQNPLSGANLLKDIVPLALQAASVIWILVLIKHATATTEFNLYGMQGSGMKNFRIFAFLLFLTAGGAFALDYANYKPDFPVDNVIIAGIALVAFLVDCIFKSRNKKEKNVKEDDEDLPDDYVLSEPTKAVAPTAPAPAMQYAPAPVQQPVYIPVYYPYPAPVGAPTANAPDAAASSRNDSLLSAQPAPAPVESNNATEGKNTLRKQRQELKDREKDLKRAKADAKTNAKIAKKNQKAETKMSKQEDDFAKKNAAVATLAASTVVAAQKTEAPMQVKEPRQDLEFERNEIETELDPKKQWEVYCPECGRKLRVREASPYHRCPACDKVFKIRKFEAYTRKE